MSSTSRRKFLMATSAAAFGMAPFVRAATGTSLTKRLTLTTLDNGRVPIDDAALDVLTQNLKGRLLTAESEDYDATRQIWNAAIDRKPAIIVQCADASDIAHTIRFARLHKALLSVRAGGHNHVGFAVCDGGVM
ncbi:MAG: FAD-binding protein, partial [Gammaproteobacteria bacterium]|nr:FAD-binding protein [Gammaproteobacteria bacterium]